MKNNNDKISFFEKVSYGLGDTASNLFWMNFIYFLMYFYTDVFGISAGVAGTMFLITRVWDSFIDPVFGIMGDRTETRWGKFRPYLLWMAIPFGIIGILTFTTPNFSMQGKIIYAYITYAFMLMIYSAINIPYGSLMAVVSPNPKVRTQFSQYRFILAFTGGLIVQGCTLPLVHYFGGNEHSVVSARIVDRDHVVITEQGLGTSKLAIEISGIADEKQVPKDDIVSRVYSWAFSGKDKTIEKSLTVSVLLPEQSDEIDTASKILYLTKGFVADTIPLSRIAGDVPYRDSTVSLLVVNERMGFQWTMTVFALLAVIMFIVCFVATKERVKPSHDQETSIKRDLKDLMKNKPWWLLFVLGIFTLTHVCLRNGSIIYYFKYYVGNQELATWFMILGTAATLVAIPFTGWMARLFGKKNTYIACMVITTLLSLAYFFLDKTNIMTMFVLQVGINFFFGPTAPLVFAMYTDSADYSEWKTGRRATGLVMSASTTAQKLGWTVGGAVTGWMLEAFNFKANIDQTPETITGIVAMISWIPAIASGIGAILMIFYTLDEKKMKTIEDELHQRRQNKVS